jgi:UMF1 family MFS transporter
VSVAATALLSIIGPGMVVTGFLLGVVTLVAYEAAFVYYNAYLPRIAPAGSQGRVSAAGFAVGYAGSLVAFVVAVPAAKAEAYWLCFLTAAAQFALFSLPSFVLLPPDARQAIPLATAMRRGVGDALRTLREIAVAPERRQMKRFLVAYLIYEDGVNTVIAFAALFAGKTLGFTFAETLILFTLVQVTALAGSAAWARPTDTRGPRLVVTAMLVQWTVVIALTWFVTAKWQFWVVAVLAGTGLGAIQAASRTFMATLVPAGREAEFFGFYALVGKTGAVLGPLVFGGVSWLMSGNQRAAILAVGLFFLVGLALMSRVKAGGPTIEDGGPDMAPIAPSARPRPG